MNANEHQVGGRHYKTDYEHWDLVQDTGMDYLAGCATKYVSRWRKKNGVEDLKKALHYVNKLIEVVNSTEHYHTAVASKNSRPSPAGGLREHVLRFSRANELESVEEAILIELVCWSTPTELYHARDMVLHLIPDEEVAA